MNTKLRISQALAVAALLAALPLLLHSEEPHVKDPIPNRLIDYPSFLKNAEVVGKMREQRRLTEDEFLQAMKDPGVILLDARSAEKFALLHIKGAVNLSLPDMTETELAKVIPRKDSKVLIYCNNNFENEPVAFASKRARASLNIHTFNVLHNYGYTEVYELGPLLNTDTSRLSFEGTLHNRNAK